ncbi:hypothetical protein [Streptomyces anthocyanicus]|uniref:hypothetical protein n=1 Tax=Streptomyces anthocyanicus TaxID=68174 RepID=UPI0033D07BD3
MTTQPDPLAYGPTGIPCGCGKDAHSNLVPCATEKAARVFHRDQLAEWGVPNDMATDPATATAHEAVELHRAQVDTRRWVSVHELVFRAPDDGKAYRVTYEQGLTEQQEGTDEWGDRDHVVGELVEEYDRTVKAWRRVADRPAESGAEETRLALADGRDALASVLIRPAADGTDRVQVEASARGMSKAAAAYTLRSVADHFDVTARAEGDEPIPYPYSPSAALLDAARDAVPAMARAIAEPTASPDTRRFWIAVDVRVADLDDHIGDALAHAADRAETVLQEERGYNATAWQTGRPDAEQPFVPRTEREHWQAIADALNDAASAGMPVGIDLDGTLTDHRMWSVVWDRTAERWDVAGYEDDDQAPTEPEQPRTPTEGDKYVKRAEPDAGRIVTVNNVWTAEAGHTAVSYEWRDDKPGQCGSACPLDVFHRTYEAQR